MTSAAEDERAAWTLGVAVAQLDAIPFDVAANAERGAAAIECAAENGAELVVLPELLSIGYVMDAERVRGAAEPVDAIAPGSALAAWTGAAARTGVSVVAGFAERAGDCCFNSVAVIDTSGHVTGVYRKAHLFDAERGVFEPGDTGFPVLQVAGVQVGILVCYDLRFPEAMRISALRGADIICVPTAWVSGFDKVTPAKVSPTDEGPIPQVVGALVQANLNQVWVVAAGRTGEDAGVRLLGSSVVVDPYGNAVAGPLGREETVVVQRLNPRMAAQARNRGGAIRPRQDRRTDLYDQMLGYRERAERPVARVISDRA